MRNFIIALCFMVASVVVCRATQPECTGDRHYDGVACCEVPETTTTTLPTPDVDPSCPEIPPCPAIPPCPSVSCGDGTTYNVTVNRCPSVVFPRYAPCRARRGNKARAGDVIFQGRAYKCPRNATPFRNFIPLS